MSPSFLSEGAISVSGSGTDSLQIHVTLSNGIQFESNTFSRNRGPILRMGYTIDNYYAEGARANGYRCFRDGFPIKYTEVFNEKYEIEYSYTNFYNESSYSAIGNSGSYSSNEVWGNIYSSIEDINTSLHLRISGTAYCYYYHPSASYGYRLYYGTRYSTPLDFTIYEKEIESYSVSSSIDYITDGAGSGYAYVISFFDPASVILLS